ncbi:carbon-nitrogen hydrolase family protein [Streptomyces angustmyceticus]|nr:hypothetical protein [Streptomyces angustmyceticus]
MAALLTEAATRGAGLVVFSELALTHYDLDRIAADPTGMTVTDDDARLAPVREACRASGVAAVVNAAGRGAGGGRPTDCRCCSPTARGPEAPLRGAVSAAPGCRPASGWRRPPSGPGRRRVTVRNWC